MAKILTMPQRENVQMRSWTPGKLLEMPKPKPSESSDLYPVAWTDFPPYQQPDDIA